MEKILFIGYNENEFSEILKGAVREVLKEDARVGITEQQVYMNAEEAAKFLHLKLNTIYDKTCKKEIPHIKKGGKLLFLRNDLEQWLKDGKVKTRSELEGDAATYLLKRE